MKDARLRVPVAESDLLALGRAAFIFARVEWQAVWCIEKLMPGYVREVQKKTAGHIANDFIKAAEALNDINLQSQLMPHAEEFKRLVNERNAIIHGKPGTATDGAQLLFRNGIPWTASRLDDVADEFAACGSQLNKIFYGILGLPQKQAKEERGNERG